MSARRPFPHRVRMAAAGCGAPVLWAGALQAATGHDRDSGGIVWAEVARLILLQDYNTRIVLLGTTLLGLAAGLLGTFLLLRKRALLSDALAHATLPGIALAFIAMTLVLGEGKHLLGLIAGAALFAVLGTATVIAIQRHSRLKDDAALGIVLSVYFGLGVALMGIATRMGSGDAAGLASFIYGKTASMLLFDAQLTAVAAFLAALFGLLLFKEFTLICFDADFAASQGWPVGRLDLLLMCLVVVVTVIGLQAVGLILVVALLIIPPSAARFWTDRLKGMLWLSGAFGAFSGLVGAGLSALMANLPAGAVIVLTAAAVFLVSLLFGSAKGLVKVGLERLRLRRKILAENILREIYEWGESHAPGPAAASQAAAGGPRLDDLLARRSWNRRNLSAGLNRLRAGGLAQGPDHWRLTADGLAAAREVVRKHRLWETYLITHADVAAGQVDFGADHIEHVLDRSLIEELERLLPDAGRQPVPRSPHRLDPAGSPAVR